MPTPLAIIGVPTSAGAYAPGQEKAPGALRAAGLLECLRARGINVIDRGDVPGFRWRADRANPRAMNADKVVTIAKETATRIAATLSEGEAALVLGGDCTIEIGTVAGALRTTGNVGLVYIDLDTDLNTPESTDDGALDWMGVSHMLGIEGTVEELAQIGPRRPLLDSEQILFFADDNSKPFEREIIEDRRIAEVKLAQVVSDPSGAARSIINGWARNFDHLLIHVDLDVLDYLDMPLAEERRRNRGLRFDQLMAALREFLKTPNWTTLTITELNPDHGESDGSTLRTFTENLADALSNCPRFRID